MDERFGAAGGLGNVGSDAFAAFMNAVQTAGPAVEAAIKNMGPTIEAAMKNFNAILPSAQGANVKDAMPAMASMVGALAPTDPGSRGPSNSPHKVRSLRPLVSAFVCGQGEARGRKEGGLGGGERCGG